MSGPTVVGIPARDEASTVAAVARMADAGLNAAFPGQANTIVLAENGSVDGTAERFLTAGVRSRQVVLTADRAGTGKGTNVFAIIDQALELGAGRAVLLDADVRSTEPDWVGRLTAQLGDDEPTLAVPMYRRNRYEANTTNFLASPLLAGVFGAHVQQPIGGEFAFNRAFMEQARSWPRPASAQLYGIDIWLTANALREGYRVVEVPLGRKLHNSPFPKILHLPQQVLDALFHVAIRLGRARPAPEAVPAFRAAIDVDSQRQDPAVIARVTASVGAYLATHYPAACALFPSARGLTGAPWGLRVSTDDWPHLLADAVEGMANGRFEDARDHLIAFYVNRVLTFWAEIEGMNSEQVDDLLDRQAAETVRAVEKRSIRFDRALPPNGFRRGHWSGIPG